MKSFLLFVAACAMLMPAFRSEAATKCPAGQVWDSGMKMCMPAPKPAPKPIPKPPASVPKPAPAPKCSTEQYWDAAMKMCMPVAKAGEPATFGSLSKKVFSQQCTTCHMVMGPKDPAEAGIDLSSFAAMTASNNSKTNPKHAPFILAGDPEHSKLYVAVKSGKMPQKEDGSPAPALSAADVQDIFVWIQQGARNN
jgi:hypothetical protein